MLKEEVKVQGNRFSKEVEYVETARKGSTAVTKEDIVSKYPESLQLNIMRKAILGDAEAQTKLQEMEDDITALLQS